VLAVDLFLSVVKPMGALWLFDCLYLHPEINAEASNGFQKAALNS